MNVRQLLKESLFRTFGQSRLQKSNKTNILSTSFQLSAEGLISKVPLKYTKKNQFECKDDYL